MEYTDDIKKIAAEGLPWEKLEGANVLVTGATGLIGGCLIDVLMCRAPRNYHVYAVGRNVKRAQKRFSRYIDDALFHFLEYDVQMPCNFDFQVDYIIDAASNASPNAFVETPVEIMKSNIVGLANLMDFGIKHGLKRLLFISTGEIYGEGDGRVFTEDYSGYVDTMSPRSCYPSSKRAAETLCVAYAQEYDVDVVVARLSHTYGPQYTEYDNRVYAQFIRNVVAGEDIVMKSRGEQFRSWCYVVDCVKGLLYVLLKGEKGEAYNIADQTSNISIKELAEMIAKIGCRKVVFDVPPEIEQKGYNIVKKSVFDTRKLECLGWSISGTMEEKMIATIRERLRLEEEK